MNSGERNQYATAMDVCDLIQRRKLSAAIREVEADNRVKREKRGACTWRHGLHVFGKLAADAIIISADVVETPSRELLGIVELGMGKREKKKSRQEISVCCK